MTLEDNVLVLDRAAVEAHVLYVCHEICRFLCKTLGGDYQ